MTHRCAELGAESGSEFIHDCCGLLAREAGEGGVQRERVQGPHDVLRAGLQCDEALERTAQHIHIYSRSQKTSTLSRMGMGMGYLSERGNEFPEQRRVQPAQHIHHLVGQLERGGL